MPATADPPTLFGKWATGAPQHASDAAQRAAAAATTKQPDVSGGLDDSKTANEDGSNPRAAAAGGVGGIDMGGLQSIIESAIQQAIAANNEVMQAQFGVLHDRIDAVVSDDATDDGGGSDGSSDDDSSDGGGGGGRPGGGGGGDDDDDGSSDSSGSIGSLDSEQAASILEDKGLYVGVDPKSNPHWGAAKLCDAQEHKPHRYELYNNSTWMSLTKGGTDASGVLAFVDSYVEPLSLYGKALSTGAEQLAERVATGDIGTEELLTELVAIRNTAKENYRLANVARSIVVAKAKALRPGATTYDKLESRHIEHVLNNRDFAAPDTAGDVQRIKQRFALKAARHDLDHLAKKAGGSGSAGGIAESSDDDDDDSDAGDDRRRNRNKRKRAKAKERKKLEREKAAREQRKQDERKQRKATEAAAKRESEAAKRSAGSKGSAARATPGKSSKSGSSSAAAQPKPKKKPDKRTSFATDVRDGSSDEDDYVGDI